MAPRPTSRYRGPLGPDRILEYWSWVAWALFLLVTVDMLTTLFAASILGTAAEANPLIRWALGRGVVVLVAMNLLAVFVVVTFFYALVKMLERTPSQHQGHFSLVVELWLGLLIFAGLLVFANNLTAIFLGQSLL
jgi:hypothetical protein